MTGGDAPQPHDGSSAVDLRSLQLAESELLRAFVAICTEHDLRYVLLYGTLLGAIRHRGFIPWDDDVDVGMPRADFERLGEIINRERTGLGWQSCRTTAHYPFLFGRLIRLGTVLRHRATEHLGYEHALSIDIFPLDGAPRSLVSRAIHRLGIRVCTARLRVDLKHRGITRYAAALLRLVPRSWAIAVVYGFANRWPYDEARTVISIGGQYGYRRESWDRSWFAGNRREVFEGMSLAVPSASEAYLTHLFGAYREPPPGAERRSRHDITAFRE